MRMGLLAVAVAAALGSVAGAGTIYVDADASGGNNGISWFDAFNELTLALGVASAGDEVWVAEGTYIPLGGPDDSFVIPPGVTLLGGFRGTEVDADQRDPAAYITVLDGDVNGDDQPGFLNRSDNRRHVVRATAPTVGTVLDGFVVRGGYAVDTTWLGGGLIVEGGTMRVAQCAFIANGAEIGGGGAYFGLCDRVRIYDCVFSGNATHPDSTGGQGGGVYFVGEELDVQRSSFVLNLAAAVTSANGGGVYARSDGVGTMVASFRDCEFAWNGTSASTSTVGAACAVSTGTSALFTRCTFLGNECGSATASQGGGIWAYSAGGAGELSVGACSFLGNTVEDGGSAVFAGMQLDLVDSLVGSNTGESAVMGMEGVDVLDSTVAWNSGTDDSSAAVYTVGDMRVANSVVHGNTNLDGSGEGAQLFAGGALTADYSCVEGWDGSIGGSGSFDALPRFMDPDGADNTPGTADDDFRLRGGSPCIDAGDNASAPDDAHDLDDDGNTSERIPLDLDLNPRRLDDTGMADSGNGTGALVDIGAYEFQGTTCVGDADGNGVVDTRDVLAYLLLWAAGDGSADVNGDGRVDTQDVLAFLNAWTGGC